MKKLIRLLLLVISFQVNAQSFRDFEVCSSVQHKSEIANFLWNEYMFKNLDTLLLIGRRLYIDALEHKHNYGIATANRCIGTAMIRKGQREGLKYLQGAIFYYSKHELFDLNAETLNEVGVFYHQIGAHVLAKTYFLRANEVGLLGDDPTNSFIASLNLAQHFMVLKAYDKAYYFAEIYKNKSLHYGKLEAVSNAFAVLGAISQLKNEKRLATENYKQSIYYARQLHRPTFLAHAYTNRALYAFETENHSEGLANLSKALKLHLVTQNPRNIYRAYFNLGVYYQDIAIDKSKAYTYFDSAWRYISSTNWYNEREELLQTLLQLSNSEQGGWGDLLSKNEEMKRQELKRIEADQMIFEASLSSFDAFKKVNKDKQNTWPYFIAILIALLLGIWVKRLNVS